MPPADGHPAAPPALLPLAAGPDIRGDFVCSPSDDFEWDVGYDARFDMTYVADPTQRSVPEASFAWYRNRIETARRHCGHG